MANITTGSIVADISGRVGDNVYSRNKYGPYIRLGTSPTQPNSVSQLAAQALMSDAMAAFQALSDSDFLKWKSLSKNFRKIGALGFKISPDPVKLFISSYLNLRHSGILTDPQPVMPVGVDQQTITLDNNPSGEFKIDLQPGPFSFDHRAIAYSNLPVSPGIRSVNSVPLYAFTSELYWGGFELNFSEDFMTRFKQLSNYPGRRSFVRVRVIDSINGFEVADQWASVLRDPYTLSLIITGSPTGITLVDDTSFNFAAPIATSLVSTDPITSFNKPIEGTFQLNDYVHAAPFGRTVFGFSVQTTTNQGQFRGVFAFSTGNIFYGNSSSSLVDSGIPHVDGYQYKISLNPEGSQTAYFHYSQDAGKTWIYLGEVTPMTLLSNSSCRLYFSSTNETGTVTNFRSYS